MLDLYEYEATPEGGGDGGTGADDATISSAEPLEPAEPDTGDPGDAQPEAAAEPEGQDQAAFEQWLGDELDARLNARLAQFQGQPQGVQPQPQPGQQGFDWSSIDPYSEDFGSQLGQGIQATIQGALDQALSPVTQTLQQQQEQAAIQSGEALAQDMISDEISRNGDFASDPEGNQPSKQLVRPLAEVFMPQAVQRYGQTSRAAETAIEQAAQVVRQIERVAAEAALRKDQNHLATLAGAQTEPGGAPINALQGQPAKYMSPEELVRRHASGVKAAA
jgi:hypothetical protein